MKTETDDKQKEEFYTYKRTIVQLRDISIIITILILLLAFFDKLPWIVLIDDNDKSSSLEKRLIFTLQLLFVDVLPLLVAMTWVIHRRLTTIAINPMNRRGHQFVEQQQRILQNTLEQFIIKFILSLTLCTVLRSNELIILPVFTVLFVL
ncbi:unnamed protein product, partial [Rotaria sp. Silwood1]